MDILVMILVWNLLYEYCLTDLVLVIFLLCHNCQNCGNTQLVLGIVDYLSEVFLINVVFVSKVRLSLTSFIFHILCVNYKNENDVIVYFALLYLLLCFTNISLMLICMFCLPFDIVRLVRLICTFCLTFVIVRLVKIINSWAH